MRDCDICAELLLTVREAFDADAGMAILIDRVLSSAALSTKEDGK